MAEGAEEVRWNHTATITAMVLHAATDMTKHQFNPEEFHALHQAAKAQRLAKVKLPQADITDLKAIFVDRRPRG